MKKDLKLNHVVIKDVPYILVEDEVHFSKDVVKRIELLLEKNPNKTIINFNE